MLSKIHIHRGKYQRKKVKIINLETMMNLMVVFLCFSRYILLQKKRQL